MFFNKTAKSVTDLHFSSLLIGEDVKLLTSASTQSEGFWKIADKLLNWTEYTLYSFLKRIHRRIK